MEIYDESILRVIADIHAQAIKLEKLIDNALSSEKFEFTKLNWDWVDKLKLGETVYSGHVSVDAITEKKGTLGRDLSLT